MEHQDHDKVFFANFGKVMAGLFIIFFICIAAAAIVSGGDEKPTPAALAALEERIQPVGTVVTDPAALMKVAAAAPARAPMTGEQISTKICGGCHGAGVLGAPKIGDKAAWSARLSAAGGLNGLVASAVKGKNAMPAKGGDASLSDAELHDAVQYLLKQAGL